MQVWLNNQGYYANILINDLKSSVNIDPIVPIFFKHTYTEQLRLLDNTRTYNLFYTFH